MKQQRFQLITAHIKTKFIVQHILLDCEICLRKLFLLKYSFAVCRNSLAILPHGKIKLERASVRHNHSIRAKCLNVVPPSPSAVIFITSPH